MENKVPEEQFASRVQKYHKKQTPVEPQVEAAPPPEPEEEEPEKEKKQKKSSTARSWVITIVLAVIISLGLRIFVFEIVLVDGDSMLPTLNSSQRVVVEKVSRYFHLPARGEIVITRYPNMPGYYVKRLIGYPGDTVEIKDSTVYLNGEPLTEDYLSEGITYDDMAEITVPENTVFVMGDNRSKSLDSRAASVGPIPIDYILGDGLLVIWPFDQIHLLES
jgi:signal peptidase I